MLIYSVQALSACHDQVIVCFRSEAAFSEFVKGVKASDFLAFSAFRVDTDVYGKAELIDRWYCSPEIEAQFVKFEAQSAKKSE